MKARVVQVTAGDFSRVHKSLLCKLNNRIPAQRWRRLFNWGWTNPENHVGFALEAPDQSLVGFLGTLYSLQPFGDSLLPVCNLSSWIVEPGYRSSALSLVMPVLRRRELTVTNLTSLPEVNEMFRKLGFRTLETHSRIMLPVPRPGLPKNPECERLNPEALPAAVDQAVRTRVSDHRLAGEHWMLRHNGRCCHIALTLGRRRRLKTARIHHLDHPEVFAAGIGALHRRLFQEHGTILMECDDRLVTGVRIPGTKQIPLPVSRIFRSLELQPEQLTNLYSELPLLNLH